MPGKTTFRLYLESGPKRRKTMVHVLDLLGCVYVGPTTEEAIEGTPDAIRAFLRLLSDHGETVPSPRDELSKRTAEHVTEGQWLGNGDPTVTFGPDRKAVTPAECNRYAARFAAIRQETLVATATLTDRTLRTRPARGRSIAEILEHVLGAAPSYLQPILGPQAEANAAARAAEKGEVDPREAMARALGPISERIAGLTREERVAELKRGREGWLWTSRKMFRRLLEHEWEHLAEIRVRLSA